MAFVLCCFDDSPIDDDPRHRFGRQWKTNLANAPCTEPVCCITGLFMPACTAYVLRQEALGGNMSEYMCCQGYFDFPPCFQAGTLGESGSPEVCLCIESFLCTHFAVQATRFYMMDTRQIQPDPVDNQIIRCHNALQCLAFIFELAACISRDAEVIDAAAAIRTLADCVYVAVLSCFAAQVKAELRAEKESGTGPVVAPTNIVMHRQPQPVAVAQPVQPGRGSGAYPGVQMAGQPMYACGMPVAQPVGGGHVAYAQGYGQQPMYAQPYGGGMPVAQGQPVPMHIPRV